MGITHASAGYTRVVAATGSTTSFKLADVKAAYKALPLAYRRNATWLINGDDFAELAALADTAGGLVLPSLEFDPPSLLGRPVLVSAHLELHSDQGQVGFKAYARVDGKPLLTDAARLLAHSAT